MTSQTVRNVVNVVCTGYEKKALANCKRDKQKVYQLEISWSDGTNSSCTKTMADFILFRSRLKNEFYSDQSSINIPDVPVHRRFNLVKKKEKRKKDVEDFCMQLVKLPAQIPKFHPVNDFLSVDSYDDNMLTSSFKSATLPIYSQPNKPPRLPQALPKSELSYSISDVHQPVHQPCRSYLNSQTNSSIPDPLYAEIDGELLEKSDNDTNDNAPAVPSKSDDSGIYSYAQTPMDSCHPWANTSDGYTVDEMNTDDGNSGHNESTNCSENESVTRPTVPPPNPPPHTQPSPNLPQHTQPPPNLPPHTQPPPNLPPHPQTQPNLPPHPQTQPNLPPHPQTQPNLPPHPQTQPNIPPHPLPPPYVPPHNVPQQVMTSESESSTPKILLMDATTQSTDDSDESPQADEESLLPEVVLPPMPVGTAPTLETSSTFKRKQVTNLTHKEIKVVAIEEYDSQEEGVLSFERGIVGSLLSTGDNQWWCVRIGFVQGWVPADYWKLMDVKLEKASWFIGEVSRSECEVLLLEHGHQADFVVRESASTPGQYAISVRHNDRIRHFPIKLTEEKKFFIGQHHFKTIYNIIAYYQKNDLFFDSEGTGVKLGNPLSIPLS